MQAAGGSPVVNVRVSPTTGKAYRFAMEETRFAAPDTGEDLSTVEGVWQANFDSPEAIEADREKERVRKERQRSRPVEPPALPAAGAAGVAGQAQAAAGAVGDGAGVEGVPVLAWDAKMLAPLFEQLIPTVEDLTVHQVAVRAAKCRLPPDIVREIEAEAKWSAPARKALELSAPQVAARLLNKTGISAENQPEVIFFTAISSILAGQVMTLKRLDKLAAIANVPTTKPGQPAPGVKPQP